MALAFGIAAVAWAIAFFFAMYVREISKIGVAQAQRGGKVLDDEVMGHFDRMYKLLESRVDSTMHGSRDVLSKELSDIVDRVSKLELVTKWNNTNG